MFVVVNWVLFFFIFSFHVVIIKDIIWSASLTKKQPIDNPWLAMHLYIFRALDHINRGKLFYILIIKKVAF